MANFYAQLKQANKNFDILYMEPPSYVQHFVSTGFSDLERVVLFCNKVSPLNFNFESLIFFFQ